MEKAFAIREIAPDEYRQSAAIIRAAFSTVAAEFGFTPENNPTNGAFLQPENLAEECARGVRLFGLFLPDGEQAGFVALEDAARGTWYLEKLAVLPAHRHAGLGRHLIDFGRGYVRERGGECVSIAIINKNTRLKRWYEQCGFVETGRRVFEHLSFTVCFLRTGVEE